MNTASLSSSLSRLFPPGAVVAEFRETADPRVLLPAEASFVARAVGKRVREFAAGRMCARRALAEFGIHGFALEMGPDRQPVWPDSMAGSITHTTGFCAAVAAGRQVASALGIDSEMVGDIKADIWSRICLPGEIAWIRSLTVDEQAAAVALVFSAKEAFYKCQYPVAAERLDFHDVCIEAPEWGAAQGIFKVRRTSGMPQSAGLRPPEQGCYLFHERYVTTGIAWAPLAAGR